MEIKNVTGYYKTSGTKKVTVSVTIDVAAGSSEDLILENAAEALLFANNRTEKEVRVFKSWCHKIMIDWV